VDAEDALARAGGVARPGRPADLRSSTATRPR
jgi:hypothetical protein